MYISLWLCEALLNTPNSSAKIGMTKVNNYIKSRISLLLPAVASTVSKTVFDWQYKRFAY